MEDKTEDVEINWIEQRNSLWSEGRHKGKIRKGIETTYLRPN